MNKPFKLFSTMMAVLLVIAVFLSACSKSNNSSETASASPAANGTSTTQSTNDATKDPFELNVAIPLLGPEPKDLSLVQAEINKITKAKINTTIKLVPINAGNWNQQLNLMSSGGEKLDLAVTLNFGDGSYSAAVAKGQLQPMDDLIEKYGAGIKKALDPGYLNATKISGKSYGVPSVRDLAISYGITMRKDMLDKYKIDASTIHTLDDVEKVLKTIKDNEPNVAPISEAGVGGTLVDYYTTVDKLGDGFGVLPNYDNNLKVVNYYETPEYAQLVKRFRNWYTSGYVLKDIATTQTTSEDYVKSGKLFSYIAGLKPGYAEQESSRTGTQMVTAQLIDPIATTSTVSSIMWSIPQQAKKPDRSMMFLDLLYSDKDIVNLFDWGIEGKHYVKMAGQDNMVEYPAGVDGQSVGYNIILRWVFGNQLLSYLYKGDDPQIWSKLADFNKTAKKSKALGFSFNAETVKTQYTAVTNVMNQYKIGIETGALDSDKALPEFIAKLKAAGIDKIIAEKQKQLDAWVASNK